MQIEDPDFSFRYDFASDEERAAYDKIYNELYDACLAKLFKGGYKVYTTFDLDMQQKLQACVDEELADFEETADDGKYKMQGAAVCIDNSTGQVVAMVGGRSQDEIDTALSLNRAFQSHRQPGSSIKPLVVYTPAFEKGYYPGTYVRTRRLRTAPRTMTVPIWERLNSRKRSRDLSTQSPGRCMRMSLLSTASPSSRPCIIL